jgi:hypothetical protein
MGFHDEAREIARKKLAEQQARGQQAGEQSYFEISVEELRKQDDRWRSDCEEKVRRWFNEVGMLPYPEYSRPEIRHRLRGYSYSDDRNTEPCVEITWQFDGYEYGASCYSRKPESLPTIEIDVKGRWFPVNTKGEIGLVLLQEEQLPPLPDWVGPMPSWPRDVPPHPTVDLTNDTKP